MIFSGLKFALLIEKIRPLDGENRVLHAASKKESFPISLLEENVIF